MKILKKKNTGFTLIELLVVIAIIGLLTTLAVVALDSARQKGRDAKRVTDIKQIQTAFELYFTDHSSYPDITTIAGAEALLGKDVTCIDGAGFGVIGCAGVDPLYMGLVPSNKPPFPVFGGVPGSAYEYTPFNGIPSSCDEAAGNTCVTYFLDFYLEGIAGDLEGPGTFRANPSGVFKCTAANPCPATP